MIALHDNTLTEFLEHEHLLLRPLSQTYEYQLRRSCAKLVAWLGRDPLLAELDDLTLSQWVRDQEGKGARRTAKNDRANIISILRHAAQLGRRGEPGKIRKVSVPRKAPVAWTLSQYEALTKATAQLPGQFTSGVPRAVYFDALLRVVWDTGLRRGDLYELPREKLLAGRFAITLRKTNHVHSIELRPRTIEAVAALAGALRANCAKPLAWPQNRKQIYYWLRRLCAMANVPYAALQQARRSAATDVERLHPGSAGRFLGHLTPGLAEKHYVDPTIAYGAHPKPSEL